MEFLKVIIKNKTTGVEIPAGVPVLINSVSNGKTGGKIKLDAGSIDISVKYPKTPASTIVDLRDTTATTPKVVTIYTTDTTDASGNMNLSTASPKTIQATRKESTTTTNKKAPAGAA